MYVFLFFCRQYLIYKSGWWCDESIQIFNFKGDIVIQNSGKQLALVQAKTLIRNSNIAHTNNRNRYIKIIELKYIKKN